MWGEKWLNLTGANIGKIEPLIRCTEFETLCHYTFQNDALLR